jgi:surfactin synthase thioesterase subunit
MEPLTVFCLPCAGASASRYLAWSHSVAAANMRIEPVELPGRGRLLDTPPMRELDTLVCFLASSILLKKLEKFVIFGHSLGGLLAFECAHVVREISGREAGGVGIASCIPPRVQEGQLLTAHGVAGEPTPRLLPSDGVSEEVLHYPEFAILTRELMKADLMAAAGYKYRSNRRPLSCPLMIFTGDKDEVGAGQMHLWELESTGRVIFQCCQGGHFFLWEKGAQFVAQLQSSLTILGLI